MGQPRRVPPVTRAEPAYNGIPPVTVNKDGSVVIETADVETSTRRQLIFRWHRGRWEMSICVPGVGTLPFTEEQATTLAKQLRGDSDD